MLLDSFGECISFLFVWCVMCNYESQFVGGLMYGWMNELINRQMDKQIGEWMNKEGQNETDGSMD